MKKMRNDYYRAFKKDGYTEWDGHMMEIEDIFYDYKPEKRVMLKFLLDIDVNNSHGSAAQKEKAKAALHYALLNVDRDMEVGIKRTPDHVEILRRLQEMTGLDFDDRS
jgi:hypothetical protein